MGSTVTPASSASRVVPLDGCAEPALSSIGVSTWVPLDLAPTLDPQVDPGLVSWFQNLMQDLQGLSWGWTSGSRVAFSFFPFSVSSFASRSLFSAIWFSFYHTQFLVNAEPSSICTLLCVKYLDDPYQVEVVCMLYTAQNNQICQNQFVEDKLFWNEVSSQLIQLVLVQPLAVPHQWKLPQVALKLPDCSPAFPDLAPMDYTRASHSSLHSTVDLPVCA